VADVPVLMSGGLISAVANHAALARLYDWALTFTREVVPAGGGPLPLSCSSAARSALLAL
jgi:hypothetical protein